jgi:hypothetical protein
VNVGHFNLTLQTGIKDTLMHIDFSDNLGLVKRGLKELDCAIANIGLSGDFGQIVIEFGDRRDNLDI